MVTVVTTWFQGEPEFFNAENFTIIRLKSKRKSTYQSNPYEMLSWISNAKKYFADLQQPPKYNICLANFTMPGGVVAKYLKNKFNIPYIILSHGHDIPWLYPKEMLFWHLIFYTTIKQICLASAANILLSEEIKKKADALVGKKYCAKNKVFTNGLYIEQFNPSIKGDKLKIIFIGRLVAQKAPMLFLETIKLLQKEAIPFEVVILGDGALKQKMKLYVEKNNLYPVSFKGKVSHAEVLQALSTSNVLISTSEFEAMSMAILEAVSTGVYVIATKVNGIEKVIKEDINGNIVDENKPTALLQKIKKFYATKVLKEYTYPADYIEEMSNRFLWDKIGKQYISLFKEII